MTAEMALHVVGQHAQKNVRRHAILRAMPNRPHQKIDPLQTPKSPFYFCRGLRTVSSAESRGATVLASVSVSNPKHR